MLSIDKLATLIFVKLELEIVTQLNNLYGHMPGT